MMKTQAIRYRVPRALLTSPRLRGEVAPKARVRGALQARALGIAPHPNPCNLNIADSAKIGDAVAGGRPAHLRDTKPVGERGSSPAVPSNPNSRLGRSR